MAAQFELAVQDAYGLEVAARLGVDRIELCSALPLGGVTPSIGFVEAAVATPGMPPVHVLVRPRTGGFTYTAAERDLILRDVDRALDAGAAGVVAGGVIDGRIDERLVKQLVAVAPVTFHRAFDTVRDPYAALETLIDLGVRRILTSAGAATVTDGLPRLARLVAAAGGRIEIMAGGGVRPESVPSILETGVPAIHASAKHTVADGAGLDLGSAAEKARETTSEAEAARILAAVRRAGA